MRFRVTFRLYDECSGMSTGLKLSTEVLAKDAKDAVKKATERIDSSFALGRTTVYRGKDVNDLKPLFVEEVKIPSKVL